MIDLHTHLGGAVPASVLWEILCDNGLQTEFQTFDHLQEYLTVNRGDIKNLDDFLTLYFHATELIQSSPHAASVATYQAVAKAYRRAEIAGIELRFNPLKRLRKGQYSLDAIILAAIQGLQRASMHYKVRTGIIFSLGKDVSIKDNWQIIEAAIRFRSYGVLHGAYGVVGIDMAGPESSGHDTDISWLKEIAIMVEEARKVKLGVTWHVGETTHSGPKGIESVLNIIHPDRIGHGIQIRRAKGKQKERLLGILKERQICFELCPTVNLVTRSIRSFSEIAQVVRMLDKEGIPYCLNTDNPYIVHTNLKKEYDVIKKELGASFELEKKAGRYCAAATFLKNVN